MVRVLLAFAVVGCSDPASSTTMPIGGCDGLLTIESDTSGPHVEAGTPIEWTNNPPTSGPHFPLWAAWDRTYDALPRGNYVHNAEHGGVILLYRCDAGCPDIVDALVATARAMAPDPRCTGTVTKRVIVTGDPLLPDGVQVAAVAWNHAYTASCLDPYIDKFAADHYAEGPEQTCGNGANLGGTLIGP